MTDHQQEQIINKIAQDKINFNLGVQMLLEDPDYNFKALFSTLKNYIFNSIPEKANYNTETYQKGINTIPLKPTYTPIVLLKTFPTRIAFNKLVQLPEYENKKQYSHYFGFLK